MGVLDLCASSTHACTSSGDLHNATAAGFRPSRNELNPRYAVSKPASPGRSSPPDTLDFSAAQSAGSGGTLPLVVGSTELPVGAGAPAGPRPAEHAAATAPTPARRK